MALKALMLRKKIDERTKALNSLKELDAEFEKREAELTEAVEEVTAPEEESAVEETIEAFEQEKAEHEDKKAKLEEEIRGLEAELTEEEKAQEVEPEVPEVVEETREDTKTMEVRKMKFDTEIVKREDVQAYLGEVRSAIKEKRALTNVGLLIPEVMLGIVRENIMEYSKLYKHVNVRRVDGEGRIVVMGAIPEAVWTDCCANLNELTLGFNQVELDCFKLGGFYAVCNANLEDSDIDLATELMTALGVAIGKALDKAILYGTGIKMPLGVVTRLTQTEAPSGYPATAPAWTNLIATNIVSIPAGTTGVDLISAVVRGFGNAKGKYSRGEKVWVMNETTYTNLIADMVAINASGAIVSGVNGSMPVVGGIIEVLDFIPDNVIIAGYFDIYTLAERAGQRFATSEHFRFLADQTVFKGTARYDGTPIVDASAFVAIGLNGVTPTAEMTFAPDEANEEVSA